MKNRVLKFGFLLSLAAIFALLSQGLMPSARALAPRHSIRTDAEMLQAAISALTHERDDLERFVRNSKQEKLLEEALEVRDLVLAMGRSAGLTAYQLLLLESASLAVDLARLHPEKTSVALEQLFPKIPAEVKAMVATHHDASGLEYFADQYKADIHAADLPLLLSILRVGHAFHAAKTYDEKPQDTLAFVVNKMVVPEQLDVRAVLAAARLYGLENQAREGLYRLPFTDGTRIFWPAPVLAAHNMQSMKQAEEAVAQGARMLEVDAQLTADGKIIAHWGKVDVGAEKKLVCDMAKAEVDAALGKETLDLEDLFRFAAEKKIAIMLDPKDWARDKPGYTDAFIARVAGLIKKYELAHHVYCCAFHDYPVVLRKALPTTLISDCIHQGENPDEVLDGYIEKIKRAGGSVIGIYAPMLTEPLIDRIHRAGLQIETSWEGLDPRFVDRVHIIWTKNFKESQDALADTATDRSIKSEWLDRKKRGAFKVTPEQMERTKIQRQIGPFRARLTPHEQKLRDPYWRDMPVNLDLPFDETKFNFSKIKPEEVLIDDLSFPDSEKKWRVILNGSPLEEFASMLVPEKAESQFLHRDDINACMGFSESTRATLFYNSLWAGASVNSKHFQLYYSQQYIFDFLGKESKKLHWANYGEIALADLKGYPGNVFALRSENKQAMGDALWKVVQYLQGQNIPFEFAVRGDTAVVIPIGKERPAKFGGNACAAPENMGLVNLMDKAVFDVLTEQDIRDVMKEATLPDARYRSVLSECKDLLSGNKIPYADFLTSLQDVLPLDFGNLSLASVKEISVDYWPAYKDYASKQSGLAQETKALLALPSLVDHAFSHTYRYGLHLFYALGYLRQLSPGKREAVLEQIRALGYASLAQWLSENHNAKTPTVLTSIRNSFPGYTKDQLKDLGKFVRLRDKIARRSRALRVGLEAILDQEGDDYRPGLEQLVATPGILEILYGMRPAAVVEMQLSPEELERLKETLWAFRQVEGISIHVLPLGEGKYYVYDEYALKKEAPDDIRRYTVTTEGLEHRIKIDFARGAGTYYDLPRTARGASQAQQDLMHFLARAVAVGNPTQRFAVWDKAIHTYRAGSLAPRLFHLAAPEIDANTTATMNRPKALLSQMTAELESESIFNNRIPQVVIDDSLPEIFAQNAANLAQLSKKYGVKIIHLSALNRSVDQRRVALRLARIYQELIDNGTLPPAAREILERRRVLKNNDLATEDFVTYLEKNVFAHISGVRNYTMLAVQGLAKAGALERADVIMSMDDDAPPETYVLKKTGETYNRQAMRHERLQKKNELMAKMLARASELLKTKISTEEEFYLLCAEAGNYERLRPLIEKYFAYSQDGKTGLIPQATGQICRLSDLYLDPKELKTTHQRYQSLQVPLPEYLVTMTDFIYARPRAEKSSGTFSVMPVDIFAPAGMIGKKVKDTVLPIMYGDLRGTLANPVYSDTYSLGPDNIKNRSITYIAYPFILDQDTSALAQFLRYLEHTVKTSENLQHTDQGVLVLDGVGGFAADTYVIFNRSVLDNSNVSPSIGRDLRLEEPPFIKWVRGPLAYGRLCVAFSPVAGAQQREIGERMYVIAKQDLDEVIGGLAREFYEDAVRQFYRKIMDSDFVPRQPMLTEEELHRLLGEEFIRAAGQFHLRTELRNRALAERRIRASLAAELGKQLTAASSQEQKNAMSLILAQYAHFFRLYHAANIGKDNYAPSNPAKDYFYEIKRSGNALVWQAVVPDLKVGDRGGVKVCLESQWLSVPGKFGEISLEGIEPGKPIEIEKGRWVVLSGPMRDHQKAIVPVSVDAFTEEYVQAIERQAGDQIASDGELLYFWPEIAAQSQYWNLPAFMDKEGDLVTDSITRDLGSELNNGMKKAASTEPWISAESQQRILNVRSLAGALADIVQKMLDSEKRLRPKSAEVPLTPSGAAPQEGPAATDPVLLAA